MRNLLPFLYKIRGASRPLAVMLATLMVGAGNATEAPPGDLPFGVYDPNGDFETATNVQIEHLFLPWKDVFLPSLKHADDYALEHNRSVLVTIEPWTWTRSERNTPGTLRIGASEGEFDPNMRTICAALSQFSSPVTVRWGHEMEDLSGQFIWAGWNPKDYIRIYRRFIDICREEAENIQFMWSPLGLTDLERYYPGDDYVDVVGLSVFGYQPWEKATLGREQGFREILEPRYQRALAFNKPIVVAELGFSGDAAYVEQWENDVRQDLEGFDELRAVIYFNQLEVYPWPDGFGIPNWRFDHNVLPSN